MVKYPVLTFGLTVVPQMGVVTVTWHFHILEKIGNTSEMVQDRDIGLVTVKD